MSMKMLRDTDVSTITGSFLKNPTYEDWNSFIHELVRRRSSTENAWAQRFREYRRTIEDMEDDNINVNITFSNVRILESMLYYQDPYFRVRPSRSVMDAPRAMLLENNLNRVYSAEKVGRQVRRTLVDSCLAGIGWLQVGFSDFHDPTLTDKGKVYVRRVSPLNLYVEDDISEFDDATIYCRRGTYSVRWLQRTFGKIGGEEWYGDVETNAFRHRNTSYRGSTQATLWECLDLVNGKLYLVSPQHEKIIYQTDYPYDYFEGTMYVPLQFVPDPDRLYPISMIAITSGQQLELDKLRTMQMRHRKRFNRRYLAQRESIKDEELEKIEEGEDGTIAWTEGNPANVLRPIEDAPLDPGSTRDYQMDIKADMREILGINEYLRGGFIPRTKTAQEAGMIQQGSSIRAENLVTYLNEAIIDIGRKMSMILQHEYEGLNYIQDEGNLRVWTRDDIVGDYEIEVELGSTLPPQPLPYEMLEQQGGQGGGTGNPPGMPPGTEVAMSGGGGGQ